MLIGRVIGDVVATQKAPSHVGRKILVIQPLNLDGTDRGDPVLALDAVDAGIGDRRCEIFGRMLAARRGHTVEVLEHVQQRRQLVLRGVAALELTVAAAEQLLGQFEHAREVGLRYAQLLERVLDLRGDVVPALRGLLRGLPRGTAPGHPGATQVEVLSRSMEQLTRLSVLEYSGVTNLGNSLARALNPTGKSDVASAEAKAAYHALGPEPDRILDEAQLILSQAGKAFGWRHIPGYRER